MIFAEFLHQHGFPHAAVAVNRERRHARRSWVRGQPLHGVERSLRSGIMHPALALDFPDPQVVGKAEKLCRRSGEMFKLMFQVSRISFD